MGDISKLPKWAQTEMQNLQRERDTAVKALREYVDGQTESEIYIDNLECIGEKKGPSLIRRYINGEHQVTFAHAGINLTVSIFRDNSIELRYGRSQRPMGGWDVALIPKTTGNIELRTKKNMS